MTLRNTCASGREMPDWIQRGDKSSRNTLKPGKFAKNYVSGNKGKITAAEQRKINKIGQKHGCHTCGTKTKSDGKTVLKTYTADHQGAKALQGPPCKLYPHCNGCRLMQGGQVRQYKRLGPSYFIK